MDTDFQKEAFKSFTRISCAIWGDLKKSTVVGQESLALVSMLRLEPSAAIERASKILIERAEKSPPSALSLQHPFYRFSALERFLLVALHRESWGYVRIARTLGIDAKLIEPWIWALRIRLCFQEIQDSGLEYPRGPTRLGASCPEYVVTAPWTQRLLDEEMSNRDRIFIQNHLMACATCRHSLELTRRMVFKIDSLIPNQASNEEIEEAATGLQESWQDSEKVFDPSKITFAGSIASFLSLPSTQIALAVLCIGIVFLWKS
ncbi:hypothetical protein EB061_07805 [bacterium]|nr:hypothetical protein [bacterium]